MQPRLSTYLFSQKRQLNPFTSSFCSSYINANCDLLFSFLLQRFACLFKFPLFENFFLHFVHSSVSSFSSWPDGLALGCKGLKVEDALVVIVAFGEAVLRPTLRSCLGPIINICLTVSFGPCPGSDPEIVRTLPSRNERGVDSNEAEEIDGSAASGRRAVRTRRFLLLVKSGIHLWSQREGRKASESAGRQETVGMRTTMPCTAMHSRKQS